MKEHESSTLSINTLCAKFYSWNINMYLQFISFLHTDKTQKSFTV